MGREQQPTELLGTDIGAYRLDVKFHARTLAGHAAYAAWVLNTEGLARFEISGIGESTCHSANHMAP